MHSGNGERFYQSKEAKCAAKRALPKSSRINFPISILIFTLDRILKKIFTCLFVLGTVLNPDIQIYSGCQTHLIKAQNANRQKRYEILSSTRTPTAIWDDICLCNRCGLKIAAKACKTDILGNTCGPAPKYSLPKLQQQKTLVASLVSSVILRIMFCIDTNRAGFSLVSLCVPSSR